MDLAFRLRKLRQDRLVSVLVGVSFFLIAFLARQAIPGDGIPFITFYPAVIAAGFVAGVGVGAFVALLSEIAVFVAFSSAPTFLGYDSPTPTLPFYVFAMSCVIILVFVHVLHKAVDDLWQERERSDTMFQELQHRVANNMQLVANLLQLERRTARPKEQALDAAQLRIEALSRIHRQLYNRAASDLPATLHLDQLCRELANASSRPDIAIKVQQSPVKLSPDRLVILSLLTTEIVTNAIKHAFAERGGDVHIVLEENNGFISLTVADNGGGLAPDTGDAPPTLGRGIINSLVAQLHGTVDYSSIEGTLVMVTFPST